MHFVFMGVSGSGKSRVAQCVAQRLYLPYAEADQFHPTANIAKMAAGEPLTDADRHPWLTALAEWIAEHERSGQDTLMACSALKRSYRDTLRSGSAGTHFLHLDGPTPVIAQRLEQRPDHFMPAGLLPSQQEELEPLESDEAGVTLDVSPSIGKIVEHAVRFVTTTRDA